jgi:putative nucleotidyltransferase-like protein
MLQSAAMAGSRQPLPPSLWEVVALRATGAGWPPETQSRAELVARACLDEGLLPLLQAESALPPVVRDAAGHAAASRLHVDRDHALRRGLRRALEMIGSEVVVLKGSDFAHRLYVDPALRPMSDVDLLVPLARAAEVRADLERAGAVPILRGPATRVASHHEIAFDFAGILLEVHHSFVQRARHRIDYDAIWSARVPVDVLGIRTARLCDADVVHYLLLSIAKDSLAPRLLCFVDLWLALRAAPRALEGALERAHRWSTVRATYAALAEAGRILPELDGESHRRARESLLPASERRWIDRYVLPRGAGKPTRAVQLWRKLWLLDDMRHRTTFFVYHAGAVAHGLWVGRAPRARPGGVR